MKQGTLIKFSLGVLAVFCFCICLPLHTVKAFSLLEEKILTEEETNEDSSEDTNTPRERSNHLNLGNVRITKQSANECSVFGLTQAYHVCDTLYLELSLEQKNGSSYSTYKQWSFSGLSTSSLSRNINVIVPKNHYYRVKGYHAAKEGGTKESTSTQTKGVWIGD